MLQQSMFDVEARKSKETYFAQVIHSLNEEKKSSFFSWGIKYMVFFIKEPLQNVFFVELAKEEVYMKPIEGDSSIEEIQDTRTPFINIIIDLKRQILLIQDKTALFNNVDVPKVKIESFFSERLSEKQITVYLKPITDKNEFWSEVETLDNISEFDLTLNAPNLFKGRFKASEFVKEVYEMYNISEFKVSLKNKMGKLSIMKENLQDYISLASAGAGKYVLKAIRDGKRVLLTSMDTIVKIIYNEEKIEEIDTQKLENDLIDLDLRNDDIQKNK